MLLDEQLESSKFLVVSTLGQLANILVLVHYVALLQGGIFPILTSLTSEPDAQVEVDSQSKKVTVESEASAETFKQLIVAAGHKIA